VPEHQAAAELLADAVEVELAAETAVVAALGLGETLQVRGELLVVEPGGAVDALQLLVALDAAPVDAGDAQQLDRPQPAGVGHVGTRQRSTKSPVR